MGLFSKSYQKMGDSGFSGLASRQRGGISMRLALSYAFDWVALFIVAGIAAALGHIEPHKRPFSLASQDIAFPYTEHELVPAYLLIILNALVPIVTILIVTLIFVPGATVTKDTPRSLVMKRKLWELHVGWLGLALALISAWAFTESMKNLFGKPRPDLLDRCQPDVKNASKYIVGGGLSWGSMNGQLVSHKICKQTDKSILNDGFRSYPSGHSSSAAAGLIYLSLFLASKFSVTIPYVMPSAASAAGSVSGNKAFPSRIRSDVDPYEPSRVPTNRSMASSPNAIKDADYEFSQNMKVQSLRRQAAAPPLYLLILTVLPFGIAVFVAGSRWHDYRHTGFDIMFGFSMGTITAIYAFRYYHLPIRVGAGWAWGPRSDERAFWAGVGHLGFVGEDEETGHRPAPRQQPDVGFSANTSYPPATSGALTQRPAPTHHQADEDVQPGLDRQASSIYQDVELQNIPTPAERLASPPPRL